MKFNGQNKTVRSAHLDLNVHQMAGFDLHTITANLAVPDRYEPVIIMAIGYPGDVDTLPENLKAREFAPRERYVEQEFVMNKTFSD